LTGDGITADDVLSFDEVLDDITLYWLAAIQGHNGGYLPYFRAFGGHLWT
jgi:hypothetical protein